MKTTYNGLAKDEKEKSKLSWCRIEVPHFFKKYQNVICMVNYLLFGFFLKFLFLLFCMTMLWGVLLHLGVHISPRPTYTLSFSA